MTPIDKHFHRAQAQLKSQPKRGDLRAVSSRPLFQPELAEIEPKDNDQRWLEYQRKLIARKAA